MVVEYASTESMRHSRRVMGPNALESSDFTAKLNLVGLPDGQRIFYRVYFQDLADPKRLSEPIQGSFMTAPKQRRDIRFAWSGDTAGQGFGIIVVVTLLHCRQTASSSSAHRPSMGDFGAACGDGRGGRQLLFDDAVALHMLGLGAGLDAHQSRACLSITSI